jgi:hypothetical protein
MNLVGCMVAYLMGVTFDQDTAARTIAKMLLLFFMRWSGGYANPASWPTWVKVISYADPSKYCFECIFRVMLRG